MIFLMSKRVFLNVMCPKMDKNVLLNANYYIADCRSPNRVNSDDLKDVYYDEIEGKWKEKEKTETKTASRFNIKYGSNCLNVEPYVTSFLTDGIDDPVLIEKRILERLLSYVNMRNIYDEIYLSPKRGNGILFIIYYSEESIVNQGRIVAKFLADNFGEDVTFVDPLYRPYVSGQTLYKADLERFKIVERDLRDTSMLMSFRATYKNAMNTGDVLECVSNLSNHMATFKFADAIHLYELLWPNDPLPKGNYTTEQIKDLIIQRAIDNNRLSHEPPQTNNGNRINVIERYNPYNGY